MAKKDLTGKRFGKLTVISLEGTDKYRRKIWRCKCDCGNEVMIDTARLNSGHTKSCGCLLYRDLVDQRFGNLLVIEDMGLRNSIRYWKCRCDCGNIILCSQSNLLQGKSTSCGCLRSYYAKQNRNCHGESTSTLYRKWSSINTRCNNPKSTGYKDYGGRGIKLCDEWKEFWAFREWSYANGYDPNAPKGECTIDRIDVNGDYEPSNCRWITIQEQGNNKRNNIFLEYNGERHTIAQWARIMGEHRETIRYRFVNGWSIEECILGKPAKKGNSKPRRSLPVKE